MAFFSLILLVLSLTYLLVSIDKSRSVVGVKVDGMKLKGFRVLVLRRWLNRRVGLLNHISVPSDQGFLFTKTRSIHTNGMLTPIDVVFLDQDFLISEVHPDVSPGATIKVFSYQSNFSHVLELAPGSISKSLKLKKGQSLEFA